MATQVQVIPEINTFLSGTRKMLIDNQWVDSISGKNFPVYNPATGEEWDEWRKARQKISIWL